MCFHHATAPDRTLTVVGKFPFLKTWAACPFSPPQVWPLTRYGLYLVMIYLAARRGWFDRAKERHVIAEVGDYGIGDLFPLMAWRSPLKGQLWHASKQSLLIKEDTSQKPRASMDCTYYTLFENQVSQYLHKASRRSAHIDLQIFRCMVFILALVLSSRHTYQYSSLSI